MTATLNARAGELNIELEQGATFNTTFTWTTADGTPMDLTGYTARMFVKRSKRDTSTLLELTDGNGITLGDDAGTIEITITAAQTAAFDWTEGVYDFELVDGAVVTRLLKGVITTDFEVTK